MKILIIGSKGFIGSHAYHHFSNLNKDETWGCDVVVDYIDDHYILLDSTNSDFNDLFEQERFDVCINCSGAASVPDSLVHPLRDFTLNVFTAGKILEAIRRYAPLCKYIHLSSAAVYGNPSVLPVNVLSTPQPLSPYGWHKLYSEQLCREYHDFFGVQTLCLRIFSAYGPGLKKQLFWDLYQKSRLTGTVKIYGTGNESRDFIHVEDLVQVFELAIQHGGFNGEAVNVGNGEEVFLKDIAALYLGLLNSDYAFSGEIKKGDPLNWCADISAIRNWGYENKITLSEGLKGYIAWIKEFDLD
ncbi:SDR family oxidoreductase [Ferruginibacter paludis]|uniref:NAD-dependent epimerase/dehydratase family protein n=1 Tax=Ferruginibacter paludis TaxID=1310417 RepID=UPI0025B40FD2|nr:SDR family oxidoreductase [Ferruginibacter paludis]MDN3655871.1 SDR family oxidoreductase [Ferruginibacter paludis]